MQHRCPEWSSKRTAEIPPHWPSTSLIHCSLEHSVLTPVRRWFLAAPERVFLSIRSAPDRSACKRPVAFDRLTFIPFRIPFRSRFFFVTFSRFERFDFRVPTSLRLLRPFANFPISLFFCPMIHFSPAARWEQSQGPELFGQVRQEHATSRPPENEASFREALASV